MNAVSDNAPTRTPILNEPWRPMTLPGLARGAALMRPERVILADAPGTNALMGRAPKSLRAVDLDAEATLLARKLAALGLCPGERCLVLLPNIVEAGTGILGVLVAGAIPAVTPVFTTEDALLAQANAIGAAGILTITSFAGAHPAEMARNVAARCETIRFVAAFGERAPGGVAALDSWSTIEFFGEMKRVPAPSASDDALITFDAIGGEMRSFVRRHEQLIGEAARAAALAQIGAESQMVVTIPPASAAGVIVGLAMPLLTGASCSLIALFDGCTFAHALGSGEQMSVVLPSAAEEAFHRHCAGRKIRAETLIFIHRPDPARSGVIFAAPARGISERALDCVALGEAGCQIERRSKTGAATSDRQPGQAIFAEAGQPLRLEVDGQRLIASGPLAPTLFGTSEPAVDTGFSAELLASLHGAYPAPVRVKRSSAA